ncbi:thioredoxin [Nitzschia inconspicua]|uniref:Thioredoxin n=1 Tax=Nitzschia inconspicua TaxID=303405 RepID=A0A9K3L8C8_9STRA|nr:thioredoxin [Nitzschia inconspicua]
MTVVTMKKAAVLSFLTMSFVFFSIDGFSFPPTISTGRKTPSAFSLTSSLYASKYLVEIDDSNFRDLFRSERPILVDCCAQWCGPCKLIEPALEECAKNWHENVTIGKYDVESGNDQVKVELFMKGVMPQSLPALILIHRNTVLATHEGIIRRAELDCLLEQHVLGQELVTSSNQEVTTTPRQTSGLISFAGAGSGDEYMLKQV